MRDAPCSSTWVRVKGSHWQQLTQSGLLVAGIDEVGVGSLAGPLVAAACVMPPHPDLMIPGVRDSKKLSTLVRLRLSHSIKTLAECWALGEVSVHELDEIGIYDAIPLAQRRAVRGLSIRPAWSLIDGNRTVAGLGTQVATVVGGDDLEYPIACASILAKVHRDRMMQAWDREFPEYGWAHNAGYPTQQHVRVLEELGITDLHRLCTKRITKVMRTRFLAGQRTFHPSILVED